ncbi:MAG TPA: ubiquitin-like domain-containing protein [Aeromicrobium sp.]|nr:ubiquitin-like domain-containing protein [Aeromicrobium sp.]
MRIPQITSHHLYPKHLHKVPHKKSIFVAANAAVLLILGGSTAAYASLSKDVTVSLDGQPKNIRTMSGTVAAALASDGITLTPHDKIKIDGKPASKTTPVDDGAEVAVAFAKPVIVAVDGKTESATVHDHTVGDVLDRFGVKPSAKAFVSGDRSERLSRSGTRIVVSNPKELKIEADGKSKTLTSTAPTVGSALKAAGVELDGNDEVEPAVGELLTDGDQVKVTRIEQADKTEVVDVAQPVVYKDDKTMEKGTTKVLDPGQEGRAREHVLVTKADGQERSRLVLESAKLAAPETKIVARGIAEAPFGVWDKIAACESGGNWHINTGNGYYGGLQFSAATWHSVGGTGLPSDHSREVQIKFAKILQARSGWGQWGCAGARNN